MYPCMTSCRWRIWDRRCPPTLSSCSSFQTTCLKVEALTAHTSSTSWTPSIQSTLCQSSNMPKNKGILQKLRSKQSRRLKSLIPGGTCFKASLSSRVSVLCLLILYRTERNNCALAEKQIKGDSSAATAEKSLGHDFTRGLPKSKRRGETWRTWRLGRPAELHWHH